MRETHNFFKLHFHQTVFSRNGPCRLWSFRHNLSSSGLIQAKLNFERQFSREFAVLCAMIAQNAFANGGATNNRQRREQEDGKPPGRGQLIWGSLLGQINCGAPRGARAQRQPDKAKSRPAANDEGMFFKPASDCKKNAILKAIGNFPKREVK